MIAHDLTGLKLRSFIQGFRNESPALWFLCFYIFIEYIRPQGMYPAIDFLPWGMASLFFALLSIFITGSKAPRHNTIDKMFTIMTLLVILSGVFAWSTAESVKYWGTYASWIIMYFCIISTLTNTNRMLLFIIFFILINFKLSQFGARAFAMRGFSFTSWGLSGSPGWFHNSGELALEMVVMFSLSWSILAASKDYISLWRWRILLFLFPGTAALTVIGSSSRGGQIALAVILFLLFLKTKNFFRNFLLFSILAYTGLHLLPEEQIERFNTMGEDPTSQYRLMHWEHALETLGEHPFGIGYKNWLNYYATMFETPKIEQIHNTVLEAFIELGYPGGILFLTMVITTFLFNHRTNKEMLALNDTDAIYIAAISRGINLSLLGMFIAAFFMSVLYYPMFWLTFSLSSALRNIAKDMTEKISRANLANKFKS